MSADLMRGKSPFSSASPASRARPVIVPIASKKFENSSVNTNMMSATTLTLQVEAEVHGADEAEVGSATMPPANPKSSPNGQIALTIAARTVPPTSAMRIAPFTAAR
jgi:hypothetical protein